MLLLPSLFVVKAPIPTATFLSPVGMASSAVVPTATLYCALFVVEDGSFPMYIEFVSTKASDKPVTFDAVLLASNCV